MICFFNAGKNMPVVVESTLVAAVNTNSQGATELIVAGEALYVDSDVPEALEILGWPPLPKPINVDVPHLQGDGLVGATLSCTMGNWENEPTAYSYQWLSNAEVVGTDAASYLVGPGDVGHTITCVVTASNLGGATAAPPSNGIVVIDLAALAAAAGQPPAQQGA